MTIPPVREAARVIVLDEDGRVLLLQYDEDHEFWATPGGGIETGETREEAAARELAEELGTTDVTLSGPIAVHQIEHLVHGQPTRQVETFFLTHLDAHTVDPDNATEPDDIRAWRWWTVEDLESQAAIVYPTELVGLLRRLRAEGPPAQPIELKP